MLQQFEVSASGTNNIHCSIPNLSIPCSPFGKSPFLYRDRQSLSASFQQRSGLHSRKFIRLFHTVHLILFLAFSIAIQFCLKRDCVITISLSFASFFSFLQQPFYFALIESSYTPVMLFYILLFSPLPPSF